MEMPSRSTSRQQWWYIRKPCKREDIGLSGGDIGSGARFILNFATSTDPLTKLAKRWEQFIWGKELQVQHAYTSYYWCKPCGTRSSACTRGEWRVVPSAASRSLRQVKRCSSQTEKEELTLVIHYYLYRLHKLWSGNRSWSAKIKLFKEAEALSKDRKLGPASSNLQLSRLLKKIYLLYLERMSGGEVT